MNGDYLMAWAARRDHVGGFPRRLVFAAVGAFAKAVTSLLNTTAVHNSDMLLRLVRSRPAGVPLVTVSNHMSTLDDPLMWGFKGFPTMDAELGRWVLAAEDICFRNSLSSYLFRLGKCIPITRGAGIYQKHMNEALNILSGGGWLHTFPEGKVNQEDMPIRRLKWGTASLIARAPVTPVVLPIVHSGFERVMPEKSFFRRRPPFPLCKKDIRIMIGEPLEFDIPGLRLAAAYQLRGKSSSSIGQDEAAQRQLYINISDQIRTAMERLRCSAVSIFKLKV